MTTDFVWNAGCILRDILLRKRPLSLSFQRKTLPIQLRHKMAVLWKTSLQLLTHSVFWLVVAWWRSRLTWPLNFLNSDWQGVTKALFYSAFTVTLVFFIKCAFYHGKRTIDFMQKEIKYLRSQAKNYRLRWNHEFLGLSGPFCDKHNLCQLFTDQVTSALDFGRRKISDLTFKQSFPFLRNKNIFKELQTKVRYVLMFRFLSNCIKIDV